MSGAFTGDQAKRASGGHIPARAPHLTEPWAGANLPSTEQRLEGWFSLLPVVGLPGEQPSPDRSLQVGILGLAELSQVSANQHPAGKQQAAGCGKSGTVIPTPRLPRPTGYLPSRPWRLGGPGAVWPAASMNTILRALLKKRNVRPGQKRILNMRKRKITANYTFNVSDISLEKLYNFN